MRSTAESLLCPRRLQAAASALPEASAQNTKHTFDKFKFAHLTDSELDFRGDFMYFLLRLGCSQTARTGTSTSCAS